jgi:hypothetical protein
MQIENVTRNHRIGGRMVLLKKRSAEHTREGLVEGFRLKLEGGREMFVEAGDDIEVTSGGSTQTRTRGRVRSRR